MEITAGLFQRGQTYGATDDTTGEEMLGIEAAFEDRGVNVVGLRTDGCRKVRARLVRNMSGGALLPGQQVTFTYANGQPGIQVGAAAAALAPAHQMGVVDDLLPAAGVANHDIFWLTVEGPTDVIVTTGQTVAINDQLVGGGSGTAETVSAAPGTATAAQQNALAVFGTALSGVVTAGAGAKVRAVVKCGGA